MTSSGIIGNLISRFINNKHNKGRLAVFGALSAFLHTHKKNLILTIMTVGVNGTVLAADGNGSTFSTA